MTHNTGLGDILPALILTVLTGTLFILFLQKRKETGVNALDWLIGIFGGVALMGIFQLLFLAFHGSLGIFKYVPDNIDPDNPTEFFPLGLHPVRTIHLLVLLILYMMAEQFLGERLHSLRLVILSSCLSVYYFLTLLFLTNDQLIFTKDIISGAEQYSMLDELIFDFMQMFIVGLMMYVFYKQFEVTDEPTYKKYIITIEVAVLLYVMAAFIEVLEHFAEIGQVDAFITAIPTFLLLAFFYFRSPNFIYLAPANISFLQIVSQSGQLLYAAELKDDLGTTDFLVGPSLTSVNVILEELVRQNEGDKIEIKQFVYNGGYILFEKVGAIRAIVQTDRPAGILKRSVRYLIREFNTEFKDQIDDYRGNIGRTSEGVSPDDIFRKCVPIVQSKVILSSANTEDPSAI